jgi:hypothetical protein
MCHGSRERLLRAANLDLQDRNDLDKYPSKLGSFTPNAPAEDSVLRKEKVRCTCFLAAGCCWLLSVRLVPEEVNPTPLRLTRRLRTNHVLRRTS